MIDCFAVVSRQLGSSSALVALIGSSGAA